jgi:hypothetical protein
MSIENHFKCGLPVVGSDFYGRNQLLHRLLRQTEGRVLLIGQRRIGKSSLLRQIEYLLQSSPSSRREGKAIAILKCDAQSTAGAADDFELLMGQVIKQLAQWTEHFSPEFSIPRSKRSELVKYDVAAELFKSALQRGLKLLLLIDEIEVLAQKSRIKLRALTQESEISLFAVSATNPSALGTSEFGSAWFNFFSMEHVGLFSQIEARDMLQAISKRGGRQFTEEECSVLIEVFGPFPFFLQLAGWECFHSSEFLQSNRSCGAAFKRAFADLAFRVQPHFTSMLSRLNEKQRDVLIDVANGSSVSDTFETNELSAMALVTKDHAGRWKVFSSSFKHFVLQAAGKENAERAPEHREDAHKKWWDVASDVAAKAIGTALEKAIEAAVGH